MGRIEEAGAYEPTESEIRQECERIQAAWTPVERRRRMTKIPSWKPPAVDSSNVRSELASSQRVVDGAHDAPIRKNN